MVASISPARAYNVNDLARSMGGDRPNTLHCLKTLQKYPESFHQGIAERYFSRLQSDGRREANLEILDLADSISRNSIQIAGDDDYLRTFSKNRARICQRIADKGYVESLLYDLLARGVRNLDMEPPIPGEKCTLQGAIKRLCDEKWWRREVRATQSRLIESQAIRFGRVHKHAEIYISNLGVQRRMQQRTRTSQMLSEMQAINEVGQVFTLQELADLSISNPKNRRSELMVRMSGFEQIAKASDHAGEFYTLTCPSRMHARLSNNGRQNPKYDDTTPREAQQYLRDVFSRIRAKIHRKGIQIYGFRIAEPNHDGTPHWHLLLFMPKEHVATVRGIFTHYALETDGDEKGAAEHRFKAVAIDYSRGTATGYIAKYVSKNIDGAHLEHGIYGEEPIEASQRVNAWASTWGIRQFQQIGGPSVTIWRELRRIREISSPDIPDNLQSAWKAADDSDWASFVMAMGGIDGDDSRAPVTLAVEWNDKLGQYGEPIGYEIYGVECGPMTLATRLHRWTIERIVDDIGILSPYRPDASPIGSEYPIGNENLLGPDDSSPLEFCQ